MTDNWRPIQSQHIACSRGRFGDPNCERPATMVNEAHHAKGVSFFYFCSECANAQQKGETRSESIYGQLRG